MSSTQNWLELSLNHGLPSSLLLLSRAFTLTTPTPRVAEGRAGAADELGRVKETLLTLPEEVIKEVSIEAAAPTSSKCPSCFRPAVPLSDFGCWFVPPMIGCLPAPPPVAATCWLD
jgi:hypothetical protein